MTTQKRPLSGMVDASTGQAKPITLGAGDTLIHTEDATTTQQAGPFADQLSLYVNNPTGGALDATIKVNNVTTVTAVAAKTTVKIFEDLVVRSADGTTASTVQGSGAGLIAWGHFARPL